MSPELAMLCALGYKMVIFTDTKWTRVIVFHPGGYAIFEATCDTFAEALASTSAAILEVSK